jgi:uncharacterized protein involved in exopolysaccharide biosynthesis
MNVRTQDLNDGGGDIDLAAMWRFVRENRYVIFTSTLVFTVLLLVIALRTTPIFRAETVITSVRSWNAGGAGGLGSQLGGLANIASIAGVNLDAGNSADREAKAIVQSRSLIQEFVLKNNLIGVLLPHPSKPPTIWLAVKTFKEEILTIKEDKRSGLLTIDIDWEDPTVAAQWANGFVALANQRIRARAIDEATRNIEFLNQQIPRTGVVEVQHAIYNLIENETKTLMVANARTEFAFTVIDPAVPPERKLSPRRSLYVLCGALVGFSLGMLIAYLRSVRVRSMG